MEDLSPHTRMMRFFFLAALSDNDGDFSEGLALLANENIDVFSEDNTLFRELSHGRWTAPKCRTICNKIMDKTGMSMQCIRQHISTIYHLPYWNEQDYWTE